MLFHVEMTVNLPPDMDAERAAKLKSDEKAMAQKLQQEGIWRHLWRIAGRYANISVFDVESPAHLHDLLSQLPLFPYMAIEVRALCPPRVVDSRRRPVTCARKKGCCECSTLVS